MDTAWYTPESTNPTEEYWAATADERLVIPYCLNCETYFFYPRQRCPDCMSSNIEYRESTGRAELASYTTIHRPPAPVLQERTPYITALVRLEEGVQLMTNIAVDSEEDLDIGIDLEVTWRETAGEYKLPYFQPIETDE